MTFALASQIHIYLPWGQRQFAKTDCETDGSYAALKQTKLYSPNSPYDRAGAASVGGPCRVWLELVLVMMSLK